MEIDADRLAQQISLAYEFMETLHGQAIALIKDVESQLAEAPEEVSILRTRGYRFAVNPMSYGLERPQPVIAEYYAVYFRSFRDRVRTTPLDEDVPPICFLKIVLRERSLEHPEARFGVMTEIAKPAERGDRYPKKFEDIVNDPVTSRALLGPAWAGQQPIERDYEHSYVTMVIHGMGVRLAELPDSEAIAERLVEPLLEMYRVALP